MMDPLWLTLAFILVLPGLLAMIIGTASGNRGLGLIGFLIVSGCLYVGYLSDYDNGLTVDSPAYDGGTVHVFINVTTPAPTPTLFLNNQGMVCTPLNASEPSGGYVCLPAGTQGGP